MKLKLTIKNYSIFAVAVTLSATIITNANASDDPLCYFQTRDGRQIDLSKLCDRPTSPIPTPTMSQPSGAENPTTATGKPQPTPKPAETPKIGKLDPNAPVDNPVIRSSTPPAIWNAIPDLPSPPTKGRTTP